MEPGLAYVIAGWLRMIRMKLPNYEAVIRLTLRGNPMEITEADIRETITALSPGDDHRAEEAELRRILGL